MSFLPERTTLGSLEIIEVYDFYDRPILFSCKNKSEHIFIVVWVDSSESADTWLYAPVSSSRFLNIKRGTIELRYIFTNSEDSFVYQVKTPHKEKSRASVELIFSNEIPDDYLPSAGQIIEPEDNLDGVSIEPEDNLDGVSIEQVSRKKRREILDFVLQFPQEEVAEAPISNVGDILSCVQEIIDAIGQIKLGKSESRIIPPEVTEKTQVVISGMFKGSFGMRLEGLLYEEDYLRESLLGQCINEFIELINLGADEAGLQAKLYSLKKKTAHKYINFLNALTKIGISQLHIDWASPRKEVKQSGVIALEAILQTLKAIKNVRLKTETTILATVKTSVVNFTGKRINLVDINENKTYKCVISESASKDVDTISRTATYLATIQKYIILNPVIEKEKHEYELLSLKIHQE